MSYNADLELWNSDKKNRMIVFKAIAGKDTSVSGGFSLEAVDEFKGYWIRHWNGDTYLADTDHLADDGDATFLVRSNPTATAIYFESSNRPKHFLRHSYGRLKNEVDGGAESDDTFEDDHSWKPTKVDC